VILSVCFIAFIFPLDPHAEDLAIYRQTRLAPDDPSTVQLFGADVQVAGRTAVVAGVDISLEYPVFYVFHFENGRWVQQARLELPDLDVDVTPSPSILVATRIDASATRVVIGSPGWSDPECVVDGNSEVRVFVFERDSNGWRGPDEIGLDDGCYGGRYGASLGNRVNLSGNRLAVGGDVSFGLNGHTGFARLYTKTDDGWQLEESFGCNTGVGEDGCAHDISLDGNVLLVGAAGDMFETVNDYSGRVYVHEQIDGLWNTTVLFSEGAAANPPEPCDFGGIEDNFGDDLAVSGTTLAILDPQSCDDGGGGNYGGNPIQTLMYEKTGDAWLPSAAVPEVIPWLLVRNRMWVWDRAIAAQAIYTRNESSWSRALILDNLGPFASEDRFVSYDFDGGALISGDPYSDISGNNVGSAVIYSLSRFDDVPYDSWAHDYIDTLAANGITSGCGVGRYCPGEPLTRSQAAVFLERGMRGRDFVPPAPTGDVFLDVSALDFAAAYVEQLFADGITAGCGGSRFCPKDPVTRAQVAVLLLKAKYGATYEPPTLVCAGDPTAPCTTFGDVAENHWAAAWIEQLAADGISNGCGDGNYCPEEPVTRAQMAVLLVRTFGLR
jgi:hypothetical protein